jgi:AhpD family alkylhydroperoxidase
VHVVDRDWPPPRYSATSTIVASTALILTNAKPCAERIFSVSAAVLSGRNDLQTAFGRTLDATTRLGIALVFTEVKGCRYCKAVHTFAATTFGRIPADELELFRQAAPRSSTAPPPSRKGLSKSRGKVSDADLEAVR